MAAALYLFFKLCEQVLVERLSITKKRN